MNFLRRVWKRLVIILTTPITPELLFGWWRRKRPPQILELPKDEPEVFIRPLELKKYRPGPRFIMERRRRAMKAGKGLAVGPKHGSD